MHTSIASLETAVQSILKTSINSTRRLRSASASLARSERRTTTVLGSQATDDDARTIKLSGCQTELSAQHTQRVSRGSGDVFGLAKSLKSELLASRVYMRNKSRHSQSSLPSAALTYGCSFLSGLSLAQVSDLSVISLPIAANDLWNASWYSRTRPNENILDTLKNSLSELDTKEEENASSDA